VSQPATNVLLKVAPKGDKLRKSLRSLLNSKGWRKRVGWLGFIHSVFVIKVPHLSIILKKKSWKENKGQGIQLTRTAEWIQQTQGNPPRFEIVPPNLTQPKPSSFPGAKNIVNGTLTAQGHIADTCCRSCVLSTESLKILHYVGFFCSFLSLSLSGLAIPLFL